MIASALNISTQVPAYQRPVKATDPRSRTRLALSIGTGLLNEHQMISPAAHVWNTLLTTHRSSDFRLGPRLASEVDRSVEPPVRVIHAKLFQSQTRFGERTFIALPSVERIKQELDTIRFLTSVRQFIDIEQLLTARKLLEEAPAYILNDQQAIRLRSILAPPTIKRIEKQDANRSQEYKWLETESHKYSGRWVALDGDSLLAEAESLRDLRVKLQMTRHGRPPLIHHIR